MSTINKNLTGYWPLNDTSSQGNKKIAVEASGNNRHGELKGNPALVADNKFGKVIQLDGDNPTIDTGYSFKDWIVAIVGANTGSGGNNVRGVVFQPIAPKADGNWILRGDVRGIQDGPWSISLLAVKNELVERRSIFGS